jgi:hypothetical protein
MEYDLPGPAVLRSLDEKFEEWKGMLVQRKVERPNNPEADTWLLLSMLIHAVLQSDDPECLNRIVNFLQDECYSQPVLRN